MSNILSDCSMSNNQSFGIVGSELKIHKRMKCFCQEKCILCTVTDMNNLNFEETFWGCRCYINQMDKSCNFFKRLDIIDDERNLNIERQKNFFFKLKNKVVYTTGF